MKSIFLTQIIVVAFFLQFFVSKTMAAESLIKVMDWNIGTFDSNSLNLTPEQRKARMQRLAEAIKQNKVEIVYLQEFNSRHQDLPQLIEHLRVIDYPLFVDELGYEGDRIGASLVLLSKFPFDANSRKTTFDIRGNRSAQSIIVRNTPLGWIRLSNLHTHFTEPCNNFRSYLNFFIQFDPTRSFMAGDANLGLWDKPITHTRPEDSCTGIDWDQVNLACTDANNCVHKSIDWFFVFKESELFVHSSYDMGNISNISDGHPAIIAFIGSKTAAPSLKQGDLDNDGDVDVFDYNILLGKFDATGAPGFHAADIIQNGTVDIFDYNKLIENLGK